jgi:hypothetical protein
MSAISRCIRPVSAVRTPFVASGFLRRYSSPAKAPLPLEGYRVLDMTRVLAGVGASRRPELLQHLC